MSVDLTKSPQSLLQTISAEDLQLALSLLAASQQKSAAEQLKIDLAEAISPIVELALEAQPCKPSAREGSAWTGSIVGGMKVLLGEEGDKRTYTVQLSIKDDAASAVRKAGG